MIDHKTLPFVYEHEKVHVRIAGGPDDPEGYPPGDVETLWAMPQGDGLFMIENIPFFIGSLAFHDVVRTVNVDGAHWYVGIEKESGHGTIRIFMQNDTGGSRVCDAVTALGCAIERYEPWPRYFVLNVPPGTETLALIEYLAAQERAGTLAYSEACKTW